MDASQRSSWRLLTLVFGIPVFLFALLGFPILMFYSFTSNLRVITAWSLVIAAIVLIAILFLLYTFRKRPGDEATGDTGD